MRSLLIPLLFGLALATVAFVARSGWFARDNPGRPINSAMREALAAKSPQWTTEQAHILAERYAGAHETESGLRFVIRNPGTGDERPRPGQVATLNYSLKLLDGTPIESNEGKGAFNFVVGTGKVIAGWDEVVQLMRRGEKRTVIVPYWLAYGEKGARNVIPPKAALVFEIELVDFK